MTDNVEMIIWGREFSLRVDYETFEDETVTDEQKKTFEKFLEHSEWIDKSKKKVEEYCKERVLEDDENQKKDNIFSYIKPQYLFVTQEKQKARVALMCNYRYDPEHGLAIIYSKDGEAIVDIQDAIL